MLPIETKEAMLVGLDNEYIVTGAYTHDGGVCPMLAAHRRGGRTSQESFAAAWDRYTGATRGRRASERELRTLRVMLEAGLEEPIALRDLELPKPKPKPKPKRDTGERNRMPELRTRHGWAWSRLFRRYDTFVAALPALEDAAAAEPATEDAPVLIP